MRSLGYEPPPPRRWSSTTLCIRLRRPGHAADRHTGALRWSAPLSATQDAGGGLAAGQGHLVVPTVRGADVFRTAGTYAAQAPEAATGDSGGTPTGTGLAGVPSAAVPAATPTAVDPAGAHQADVARPGTPDGGRRLVVTVSTSARATGNGRHLRRTAIGDPAPHCAVRPASRSGCGRRERPRRITVRYRRRRPAPAGPPHAAYVTVRYQFAT